MKAQMDTSSIEEINKKEQFRNYAIHLEKISEDFSFHLDKIKDKSKNNVDISEEEASTVRQLYSEIIRFYEKLLNLDNSEELESNYDEIVNYEKSFLKSLHNMIYHIPCQETCE